MQRHKWGIISALITKHLGISLLRKKSILPYTLNDSAIESSDFDIFLENSICFMCFWFGLEILRLVYLKSVFWNIERFLSYWTFYPPKKVALPLIKCWKKFLQNWANRVSKEVEFGTDFKNVHKSRVWQKEKFVYRKTDFLSTWKFCKQVFLWEKIFGNFLMQEFYTFFKTTQNSASFDTLCVQFWRNFFSTIVRKGAIFLEVKRSLRSLFAQGVWRVRLPIYFARVTIYPIVLLRNII